MINITPNGAWTKCKDCNSWANLVAPRSLVILYTFSLSPLLNWVYYDCVVCGANEHVFLIDHLDPSYLLAVLRDYEAVDEVEGDEADDLALNLFASTYGAAPKVHKESTINLLVKDFADRLVDDQYIQQML